VAVAPTPDAMTTSRGSPTRESSRRTWPRGFRSS
jgi:hypothetical protein